MLVTDNAMHVIAWEGDASRGVNPCIGLVQGSL